jgi:hypothetical protein
VEAFKIQLQSHQSTGRIQMNKTPKDPHVCAEKMCGLTSCVYAVDAEEIMPLINNPQFICTNCEQVANNKNNLCQPEALSNYI